MAKGNAGKLKYQKKMNKYLELDGLLDYRMERVFEKLNDKERKELQDDQKGNLSFLEYL